MKNTGCLIILAAVLVGAVNQIGFGFSLKAGVEEDESLPVPLRLADKRMRTRLEAISDQTKRAALEGAIREYPSRSVEDDRQTARGIISLADGDPIITAWVLLFIDREERNTMLRRYSRLDDLPILANLLFDYTLPEWYPAGVEREGDGTKGIETLMEQIQIALGVPKAEQSMPSSRFRNSLLGWFEVLLKKKGTETGLSPREKAIIDSVIADMNAVKAEQRNPPKKRVR